MLHVFKLEQFCCNFMANHSKQTPRANYTKTTKGINPTVNTLYGALLLLFNNMPEKNKYNLI